jgi:RNA polymerase sigma factor (sigma-70 family)
VDNSATSRVRGGQPRVGLARELLPQIEKLISDLQGIQLMLKRTVEPSWCETCSQENCRKPCENLNAHLPSIRAGKLHGEITGGIDFDQIRAPRGASEGKSGDEEAKRGDRGAFKDITKVESFDAMKQYEPCWNLLTHQQQEMVRLYHGEGKRIKEVAEILGKSPSTISGLLKRARNKKEEYDERMRRQELGLQHEMETKLREF